MPVLQQHGIRQQCSEATVIAPDLTPPDLHFVEPISPGNRFGGQGGGGGGMSTAGYATIACLHQVHKQKLSADTGPVSCPAAEALLELPYATARLL